MWECLHVERGQRGRGGAVTHSLRGLGPRGPGGQRLAPEPPVTASLAAQVRGGRTCRCLRRASVINPLCFDDLRSSLAAAAAALLPVMKRIISLISRRPLPFLQSPGGVSDGRGHADSGARRHRARIKP